MTGFRFGDWNEATPTLNVKFKERVLGGARLTCKKLVKFYAGDLSGVEDDDVVRPVALKPNEEEMRLEWWISILEYISKQQSVEDRHTLHRNGIPVSEPVSDNIPKDMKVYETLNKLLELGLKEEGKVDTLLELVQQVVSNIEEGYRKWKFIVEGEEEEEIDIEHVKNMRIMLQLMAHLVQVLRFLVPTKWLS
ncbi:hypothetical protein L1987_29932 [Smallanthus sonchifolius]|uniref:Uncharacterized protein n=1 Tax=Smallanthus sonchifolius TaxID=185202 RepID=A0ACB9I367_9ASTR|nr:hypothetical protein L1987_29932 [Smallanthus sonchifolius]